MNKKFEFQFSRKAGAYAITALAIVASLVLGLCGIKDLSQDMLVVAIFAFGASLF